MRTDWHVTYFDWNIQTIECLDILFYAMQEVAELLLSSSKVLSLKCNSWSQLFWNYNKVFAWHKTQEFRRSDAPEPRYEDIKIHKCLFLLCQALQQWQCVCQICHIHFKKKLKEKKSGSFKPSILILYEENIKLMHNI